MSLSRLSKSSINHIGDVNNMVCNTRVAVEAKKGCVVAGRQVGSVKDVAV